MAEGDAVHRLTRRLNEQLRGRRVVLAEQRAVKTRTLSLMDLTFVDVEPRGKHILMRLEGNDGRVTIHSHLMMQGNWSLLASGKHLPRRAADDARLVLHLDDGSTLSAVSMPLIEVIDTAAEDSVVGYLGPDILAPGFDINEAAGRFEDGASPIIEALLDQRNVCGIGNVWAVESCFIRGLYPWNAAGDVEIAPLLALNQKMMTYSRDRQKGMITTGMKGRGKTHWVYGRYKRPCRRCGTPIAFREDGVGPYQRATWWCPICQPVS